MNIDLKELSARESERVEWKEKGDDKNVVRSIVKTISAFANDIANTGGGYVVCGAREGKDEHGFPKVFHTGLSAEKIKEITGKVIQQCTVNVSPSVNPIVTELENPTDKATRILVFTIIASPDAHTYRDGEKSLYYVRIGSETKEARNGLLTQLLIKKQKIQYFDKRINPRAAVSDVDVPIFRDYMQDMKLLSPEKSLDDYFSETEQIAEFVPPLFERVGLDDSLKPKNFTLLIFGKKPSITRFYPEAYTVLSVYRGTDRSETTAERHLLTGTLVAQAKKAIELLNTETYVAFDKLNDKPNQVKYPIRALQEAVINAVVHRDYEFPEPNRITVFADRIEVRSPGALHWAVNKEKFKEGKSSPKWRNQSFAYLFNKMQLAQSEGQGIPTIIRTMREEGCPDPIFELEPESVTCILPAHPRHRIIRELQHIQDKIVLEDYEGAKDRLLKILDEDAYNFRALNLLTEVCNKLDESEILLSFLEKNDLDLYALNVSTLLNMAKVLAKIETKQASDLVENILGIAVSTRLEENQIVKAAALIAQSGKFEKTVKFISESLVRYPKLKENTQLLTVRAGAFLQLAEKCLNTQHDKNSTLKTKARAREMCTDLINSAEKDLQTIMHTGNGKYLVLKEKAKNLRKKQSEIRE